MNDTAKTMTEQLDATRSGEQFAHTLGGFFDTLAKARDEELDAES